MNCHLASPSSPLLQKVGEKNAGAQHSLFSSPTYVIHSKLFTPYPWGTQGGAAIALSSQR